MSFLRTDLLCYATLPDGYGFADSIAAASRAGFTELSLWLMTLDAAREELGSLEAVRRCLDEHGMRATSIELLHGWAGADEATCAEEVGIMQHVATLFEPEFIMAGCMEPSLPDRDAAIDALRGQVQALAPLRVAFEFLPWSAFPDPASARRLVETIDQPNLGYVLDTWHFARSGMDYAALSQWDGRRLFFVQLSDMDAQPWDDLFAETLGGRLCPGEGVVDWPRLLAQLDAMAVDCPMGTEQFSNHVKAMPLNDACEYLYRAQKQPFTAS